MASRVLILALSILATVAHAAGGGGGGGPSFVDGKINYFALEPPFVVNLRDGDRLRFMQASIQVMTYDTHVIDAIQKHSAPLRHSLLMLLSDQSVSTMYNAQARESIRTSALAEVQRILEKYAGITTDHHVTGEDGKNHPSSVQELYFTNLVIQ